MLNRMRKILNVLRGGDRPLSRLLKILLLKLPFDVGKIIPVKIRVQDDFFIRLHPSSLARAFCYDPHDRTPDHQFIKSYLRPGDVYLDVGANIGTTLIPAAMAVKDGRAVGVEPHPRIFSYLRENVALNDLNNVELHNCAAGDKPGEITFSDCRDDDVNRVRPQGRGITVPVVLLDDIARDHAAVALLKIDVEGYEKFVLRGGRETLRKTACVYFEISEEHSRAFGYVVEDLLAELEQAGFRLFVAGGEGAVRAIDRGFALRTHHTNAFAVRDVGDFMKRTGWRIAVSPRGETDGGWLVADG